MVKLITYALVDRLIVVVPETKVTGSQPPDNEAIAMRFLEEILDETSQTPEETSESDVDIPSIQIPIETIKTDLEHTRTHRELGRTHMNTDIWIPTVIRSTDIRDRTVIAPELCTIDKEFSQTRGDRKDNGFKMK